MTDQTIAVLLRKDPIDWRKVKRRLKSHPKETSKRRFIHILCLTPSVSPRFLDWVLVHLPKSHLLRKSGLQFPGKEHNSSSTPLELCLRDNGSRVPYSTFVRIVQATHNADPKYCPFERLDFLEIALPKLRVLLETYELEYFGRYAFAEFLVLNPLLEETLDWGDIHHEHAQETRLELVLRAASRLLGCERTSNGVFCVAHTFLVTVYECAIGTEHHDYLISYVTPSTWYHVLRGIVGCIKPHEFCVVDDQEGNTLLHYIIQFAAQGYILMQQDLRSDFMIDREDKAVIFDEDFRGGKVTNVWWDLLIHMLLREQQKRQPTSAWSSLPTMMVNKKGQTPLHIALLHGFPCIMALAKPCAGDDEIMFQGLFPFQLAAISGTADGRKWCYRLGDEDDEEDDEDDDAEEKEAAILTNIYVLLRRKPHLSLSTMVETEDSTALLDCPEYKELVMKELQVARMSREIKMIRKRRSEGLINEEQPRRVLAKTSEV